ncbi:cutinase [Trichodelitschia bisporula]|uniref:Cutinase n=1 Tax=Trichodelitschia bisporula TaxID=703511 RepID=A0A6G1HMY3_9PEZI|nr:cutinase [Trichodelitschia bisporula]
MKFLSLAVSTLISCALAAPTELERRQMTANDLTSGSCKKVTLIFARASTEPGNMGMSMGPAVCSGLKAKLGAGSVACQGVGGPYSAGLMDNVAPAGTTAGAINEAIRMFQMAHTKCPQSTIVAGGYSQGTAVMMNAISKLDETVRSKVAGVVLFGYTKNAQQKSGIPNYPKDKVKVFCAASDGVCGGMLLVTAGHFAYLMDGSGTQATNFLLSKIKS